MVGDCGNGHRIVICLLLGMSMSDDGRRAAGDLAPLPPRMLPVKINTGRMDNLRAEPAAVFSQVVDLGSDVPWLRVLFGKETTLAPGSYIRVTSLLDGETQILDAQELENWHYGTAFFNGSSIRIELIAGPQTTTNRFVVDHVFAGGAEPAETGGVASVCPNLEGTPQMLVDRDDRVPTVDKRIGRLFRGGPNKPEGEDPARVGGCTAFIINLPLEGNNKLHLTAGHCFTRDSDDETDMTSTGDKIVYDNNLDRDYILEFNVPPSNGYDCKITHPPVADQFLVERTQIKASDGGTGNDWAVFACRKQMNRTTYEHADENAFTVVWNFYPDIAKQLEPVRVTGFGADGPPAGMTPTGVNPNDCKCKAVARPPPAPPAPPPPDAEKEKNATQQTADGMAGASPDDKPTVIRHSVDTCPGNSGSPIIWLTPVDPENPEDPPPPPDDSKVIGIHTAGGCNKQATDVNKGTRIDHAGLVKAVQEAMGKMTGTTLTIPLAFVRVGNEAATRERWTREQIAGPQGRPQEGLLHRVKAIWNPNQPPKPGAADANITFSWPQKHAEPPFYDIDDPKKDVGGDGDINIEDATELSIVCNNAHANARQGDKRKQFPIVLAQQFRDTNGNKSNALGLTSGFQFVDIPDNLDNEKVDEQKGKCVIVSIQAKANPVVLAHELGHLLCLADVPSDTPENPDNNLMEATKDPDNTSLNDTQATAARFCVPLVLANLQEAPPPKIPIHGACCDRDPFGACRDDVTEANCSCAQCEWLEDEVCANVECSPEAIPTTSQWGVAVLTLLMLIGAKIYFGRWWQPMVADR